MSIVNCQIVTQDLIFMMKKRGVKKNDQRNDSPFAIPSNAQLFGYYQWCEAQRRLKKSRAEIVPKKINRICPILLKKEAANSVVLPMAITDIDPGYFTDLAGRPIGKKFSRTRYVEQIRNVLRTKLYIGYNRDDCLRIDQQFIEEKKRFTAIERQYRQYNNAFEEYLSTDHNASMKILNEAHEEVQTNNKLIVKRDELLNKVGQVRLEVYHWEEMWRIFPITSTSPQIAISKPATPEEARKSSQRASILGTLESLVEQFEKDISDDCLGSEEISLKDPHELSQIFATIEQRNLDALIHLESLAGPIAEMTTSMVEAEELIGGEIQDIEEGLDELQASIQVTEQRATELETYADYLLHEVFRELVCSDSVLHLRVFIEDAYESCVGPNDANLDSYSMMRVIEKTYESLNMTLDSLPREIVVICEKDGFTQEMRTMREAEDAARKFELMHRLLAALDRIMESPHVDPKSKSKSITRDSESKLSLPVQNQIKNYQKPFVPLKKFGPFFGKSCQSMDQDLINELVISSQKKIKDENTTDVSPQNDEQEDCRDDLSQIA
ncbi:hypothetical protein PV327_002490 [Microctonus hyperodae]|uniref:Uncharacterized protein n=1 Tax=Microctonus hyperodae TaxID=165561 RepID=A0AA39KPE0_MICHY|nr:hypothetical protein PV327_002490 [Microctonus hyperodae]